VNCSIDWAICSGLGGWERSGIPPGRFMPERREDIRSGVEDELLSPSAPPRGMVFHDDAGDAFVMKLRLRQANVVASVVASVVTQHDRIPV